MKLKFVCALAFPLLLLAGCEDEAAESTAVETGGKAAGEVLGGTISDDMLPLEELQSTSPPAARTPSEGGAGEGDSASDGGSDAEATEPAEAEAPAEAEPSAPAEEG